MLVSLAPHPAVVTPIGVCREQLELVTPYYRHGSADQFSKVLARVAAEPDAYKEAYQAPCNHPASLFGLRVRWMAQYARAIVYLHNSPRGVRVMCDGDHVSKLLSQFLVTDDLRFVLNDLDALPETGPGRKIKCGHRQFPGGSFVAPEQLWPYVRAAAAQTRRGPRHCLSVLSPVIHTRSPRICLAATRTCRSPTRRCRDTTRRSTSGGYVHNASVGNPPPLTARWPEGGHIQVHSLTGAARPAIRAALPRRCPTCWSASPATCHPPAAGPCSRCWRRFDVGAKLGSRVSGRPRWRWRPWWTRSPGEAGVASASVSSLAATKGADNVVSMPAL